MSKILVIEDDALVASAVRDWLEGQKHVVELTGSGEAGLHLLRGFGYDAAIVDWELPDLDGVQVIK
ncbi:MAG: response regulator, partial [Cyanobacteria bacterium]|nr:response regulator [Cyanobacteriota bacterium]